MPRPRIALTTVALVAVFALVSLLLVGWPEIQATAKGVPKELHVSGNRLVDKAGKTVVLRGVDRSGSEYACIQNFGFFDGPADAQSIAAMASWHINAVRVPLNEDCWLGINGAPAAYAGAKYRNAIRQYVNRLHAGGLIAILDLHWTAPGSQQSDEGHSKAKMPDADHAPAFWRSVATTFKSNGSTVFDLFNEPHDVDWQCWLDGGDCGIGYQAAGMQSLLDAVRGTGAKNPVLAGGLAYANDLSQWLDHRPSDPTGNLMASWHSYNFNACRTVDCWNDQVAPVAAQVPLTAGEIGEDDCDHAYLDTLMTWLDQHAAGYLGWGWDPFNCSTFPALISSYDGTPTAFGIGLRDHLAALAGGSSGPSPSASPTASPSATASPPPSSGSISVSPSTDTSSANYYWEEDLRLIPSATTTSLSVVVTVKQTAGITYAGFYTTADEGALTLTESTEGSTLVYRATLNPGRALPPNREVKLGIQFNGDGNPHATGGDTFSVSATVAGSNSTTNGGF